MTNLELARWYAALLGVGLVVLGLAGFFENPIVGESANEPLFHAGAAHNMLHVASGSVALFIAFGLGAVGLVRGLLVFGMAYLGLLVLTVAEPSLFGLFETEANLAGHALYAGLASVTIAVAWLARSTQEARRSTV